jgi:hypothetical protein
VVGERELRERRRLRSVSCLARGKVVSPAPEWADWAGFVQVNWVSDTGTKRGPEGNRLEEKRKIELSNANYACGVVASLSRASVDVTSWYEELPRTRRGAALRMVGTVGTGRWTCKLYRSTTTDGR